jgi:hypothetical protein
MAQETFLTLISGVASLAALIALWRLRPSTVQGLWIGGGMVLGVFVMLEGALALDYRWGGYGGANWAVFVLGGALAGWMITKIFRIK